MSTVQNIKNRIERLQKQLHTIQTECQHPSSLVTFKPVENQGNYDPSTDCYWVDYHCALCDKRWRRYV